MRRDGASGDEGSIIHRQRAMLFQLMGKSAQPLKESQRCRFTKKVLVLQTSCRPNKWHLCPAFESLAYTHSLPPNPHLGPRDNVQTLQLGTWDMRHNNQGFVFMLLVYPALRPFPPVPAVHTEPTIVKPLIMQSVGSKASPARNEGRGGLGDNEVDGVTGRAIVGRTQVSEILLQDPNPSQSYLQFGTRRW